MIQPIGPEALRWQLEDLSCVRAGLTGRRRKKSKGIRFGAMVQKRALTALEMGLGVRQRGFNIFVVGESGTGRTSTVNQLLSERAAKESPPDDIVLLYNFDNRDRPLAVRVPAGSGPRVKKTYDNLVERFMADLEKTFESERYLTERQGIQDQSQNKTEEILTIIDREAAEKGFLLQRSAGALTITPANSKGEAISEEEFEELSTREKQNLEQNAERLETHLEDCIRRIRSIEKEADDAIDALEKKTANTILNPLFDSAKNSWKSVARILSHLEACQEDALNRLRRLVPDERDNRDDNPDTGRPRKRSHDDEEDFDDDEPALIRYRVNVLVTHSKSSGAPVVQETHPTSANLIGRIEQRLRGGETITDHTRIRAGALYQANGGYLVLDAQDLLRDLAAWEGLKRALKNRAVELDDPGEPGRMVSVASLRPEPVPLLIKVILIGLPEIYYVLSKTDLDFSKLFKVKADFDNEMERSDENLERYARFLSHLCSDEKMRSLTPEGATRIIEQAVRVAGHQNKLTSRIGDMADLVREANYWAGKAKSRLIEREHVQKTLKAYEERESFIQNQMIEDILENRVSIETSGEVVGQANAMTVIELGSYEFGVPVRVTCRVAPGDGELIDIERETEQGGPIHTKGRLIIRGFLADCFGRKAALNFDAILCMEQTYGEIEGDSAALAEACTLFSALANVPIYQHFAITGSMDQRGHIQAVGGINEKIEGFHKICKARHRQMHNAVIMPASNHFDLNLTEEVVESCKQGVFKVYPVNTFNEAISLLTGQDQKALEKTILETLAHFKTLMKDKGDS